ncbi:MAG: DUF3667 domain-containing protein [Woeseiaceae bacterium]
MPQCKNCHARLDGAYCSTCGQRNVDLERPIWSLVGDVVKETFELDGRTALTVKTLFRHPGKLTSEFLEGRRRMYTPPLRLYLVFSLAFFILVAWFARSGILLEPGQDPGFDAAVNARFLSDDLPLLMFVLLPVFALLLKIVYIRRLYFDHLIFSIHLHSAAYVILAMVLPLEPLADRHLVLMVLQAALFAYLLAYFILAVRRVYQSVWIVVAAKTAAVLFAYVILVSVVIENTSNIRVIMD